ncbi:DUF2993 domain-containing protein [Streptacidiphilus sp. 4-A2]|nr:DUF2993 domain-containing protein [Streptacidiphilus sp. 4-A2]
MRAVRRLLIVLLVLAGLFVVADRVAVNLAQSQVASQIQSSRKLPQKPGVDIEGFPFLTQLLGGKLDEVKVHADSMVVQGTGGVQPVTLQNFQADLKGVKLENNYSTAVADTAVGSALISYANLSSAMQSHPALSYGGAGRVKVAVTVDVPLIGSRHISGTAKLTASNGALGVTDVSGITGLSDLPGVGDALVESLAAAAIGPQFQLSGLPTGLEVTQVQAEPNGVLATVAGTGVSLSNTSD